MNKFIAILVFAPAILFAQLSPSNYELNVQKLNKISAATPKSNSILDNLVVGDTVWLGTSRGLSRSTDGGVTWKNYYETEEFGTYSVTALAYGRGQIWCALGNSVEINGSNLPNGGGLRYSSDNGETWNVIAQPVDGENDTTVVYGINTIRALPVTTTINNITYDIAVSENAVWIASFAAGLRKTTDNGATWQRVVLPPDYLDEIDPNDTLSFSLQPVSGAFGNENNLNHRLFSVITAGPNTLYAGSAGGINKSTDGGVSWIKFNHTNQSNPISGNFVTALGYDPSDNSVWASTWKAEDLDEYYGVSRTTNGGVTWDVFLANEKPHNFGFVNYGVINDVLVATDRGIFRTADIGASWFLPPRIIDSETSLSLDSDVFYSVSSKDNLNGTADIWLGSDNGLVLLTENGTRWEGVWKIFKAADKIGSGIESFAYPNPFAPDLENVNIKYNLNTKSANVTIRIFDFGMNLVKTLLQNAYRAGEFDQIESWDGRDETGVVVPNGVYFYRIDVTGNDAIYGKIMVLK